MPKLRKDGGKWKGKSYDDKTETNEKSIIIPEQICSYFGCRVKLSLMEKLAGDNCTEHMIRKTFLFHDGKL